MNRIHRFILKKFVVVNQNPEREPSTFRDMLGCSEIACFLPLYENLQASEIFLGKVSDNEAIRWIENLYS